MKEKAGGYKCSICGSIKQSYDKAKRHEELCGITKIGDYVEGAEKLDLKGDIPEGNKKETKQKGIEDF